MTIDFQVFFSGKGKNKKVSKVWMREGLREQEYYLDLANIMYLLGSGETSRWMKALYAIHVSGVEIGAVEDNYVVTPVSPLELSPIFSKAHG